MKNFFQVPDRKVVVGFVSMAVIFVGALFGFDLDPEASAVGAFIIGKILEYVTPN